MRRRKNGPPRAHRQHTSNVEGVEGRVHAYVRSSRPPKQRRVSSTGTGPAWLGVESQRNALLERFPNATVWEDRAKSGRHARRPGLRAMLESVEPGDVVAVVRLDRLARDARLLMALELDIEQTRGGRIFSLSGEGTTLTGTPDPMAVFHRRIAGAVAELQASQAAAATAAAFRVKRDAGLSTNGHARFGFRVVAGGRIEPDDDEQAVLAFVLKVTRGRLESWTGRELADKLNAAGFTNRGGKPWNHISAKRLAQRMQQRQAEEAS